MSKDKPRGDEPQAPEQQVGKKMILEGLERIDDPTITYFLGMIVDRIADLVTRRRISEQEPSASNAESLAGGPPRRTDKPN